MYETAMMETVRAGSISIGLDTAFAVQFAQAQVDAGKIIQAARHRDWAANAAQAPKRNAAADAYHSSTAEPEVGRALLTALRAASGVLRRQGGRQLLDARAADLIRVGGADLLAGQAALRPLYEIAH